MEHTNSFDVFDIIGPIMVGPSSSHTAGAVRIGLMAGQLCDYKPKAIQVLFYGSLASTYSFHKTDVAVVAGTMGIGVSDERIRDSVKIAEENGIKVEFGIAKLEKAHPSTIIIVLKDEDGKEHIMRTATIGGGNIFIEEVNGYRVDLDGKQNALVGITTIKDKAKFNKLIEDNIGKEFTIETFNPVDENYSFKLISQNSIDKDKVDKLNGLEEIKEAYNLKPIMAASVASKGFYGTVKELIEESKNNNCSISETVLKFECESSNRAEEEVLNEMKQNYLAMKEAIEKGVEKESVMLANIFKGNANKINQFIESKKSICGVELSKVTRNALAVMEINGSMGKIVACPTAGSAGTVPAAVITIAENNGISDDKAVKALFAGAGIGIIAAENATISGAVGGCQGECGVASAMAAAIITEMFGGDYDSVDSAVSIALGNILGLVCDPVAGTVELPCIQRNVMAAANAIVSAEMALAGVDSVIPADEMIGALDEVGKLMHDSLKDTLGAGISNTPTARKIEAKLLG